MAIDIIESTHLFSLYLFLYNMHWEGGDDFAYFCGGSDGIHSHLVEEGLYRLYTICDEIIPFSYFFGFDMYIFNLYTISHTLAYFKRSIHLILLL